jgi:hypothetical protein
MHLILLIAFIYCVIHYGLIRGTGHFILGILRVIALCGIIIFGIILLLLVARHRF